MLQRAAKAVALAGAAVVLSTGLATTASAHDAAVDDGGIDDGQSTHDHHAQDVGGDGHLAVVNKGFSLVSKTATRNVEDGKIADVGVHKDTAYLAAWGGETCTNTGVHVMDIRDVAAPREIAFIPAKEGSYPGEGVQALSISTPAFSGDVLVTNNEICKDRAGVGGVNLYDVTNPAAPTPLVVGYGDDSGPAGATNKAAHTIHSAFAWDAGDKAYAVLVDNDEIKDVDVLDITDPRKPALIAEYDLAASFPEILQPGQGLDQVFLHDMVVEEIGGRQIMLASYWDGGYVKLDVTDPAKARLLSDSDFTNPDPQGLESRLLTPEGTPVPAEGNAHQAEFTRDNGLVIGADEDFAPYAASNRNLDDDTVLQAPQGTSSNPVAPGDELVGRAVHFGLGCAGGPAAPAVAGEVQIAVVERGVCTFSEKAASVANAGGYEGILVFNRTGGDACDASLAMSVDSTLPIFGVAPRGQGFAIFDTAYDNGACLAGTGAGSLEAAGVPLGASGDLVRFSSYFDGWGYVRLLDGSTMKELDTYAVPEAHDPQHATGSGDLSVHEVATSQLDSKKAYLSYYAAGIRAITVDKRKGITEVGAFADAGGNNFWGVETFVKDGVEYVAASDRDFGLYILKPTP